MQALGANFLSSIRKLVSVYASSSPRGRRSVVRRTCGRLSPRGRGKERKRNPRAPCARRERTTSRAALLRAADTRRTALGLAAVDAVPVLAGHGPQAVALDMTRLLARACAGTRLTRVRSIAPRETLMDLHAIDQTRSREQRRVDGVGRRRPTVLAVARRSPAAGRGARGPLLRRLCRPASHRS